MFKMENRMIEKTLAFLTTLLLASSIALAGEPDQLWPESVAAQETENIPSVSSLIDGLEKRLAENPDDAGGWLLLSKSYRHLNKPSEAADSYTRAAALGKRDPDMESWLKTHANEYQEIDIVREWVMSKE